MIRRSCVDHRSKVRRCRLHGRPIRGRLMHGRFMHGSRLRCRMIDRRNGLRGLRTIRRRSVDHRTDVRRCSLQGRMIRGCRRNRCVIGRSGALGDRYAIARRDGHKSRRAIVWIERTSHGEDRRGIVIDLGEKGPVLRCHPYVLLLRRRQPEVRCSCNCQLLRARTRLNPAGTAVVARPGSRRIFDAHALVDVDVGDDRRIDARHVRIVLKTVVRPASAVVAVSVISAAIVDATVKADRGCPVSLVPAVAAVVPTPISGGPIITSLRGGDPRARYPVVSVRTPRPVAGLPNIVRRRSVRLLVDG